MKFLCSFLLLIVVALAATTVRADTFVLAPSVPFNGNSGSSFLFTDQHIGMRFIVSTPTTITRVGGHINSENGSLLFAAIVRLADQNSFPVGWPNAQVVASTTFNPGFQGDFIPGTQFNDVFTPLNVTLDPGDYALVFGAGGFFGSPPDARGNLPLDSLNVGGGSYIVWSRIRNDWQLFQSFGNVTPRFVIESDQPLTATIPEPATLLAFGTGLAALGWLRKLRKG